MIVKIGDIFESKCSTIVNTVNCVGVMGKGIALEFKKKYPEMHLDYVKKCNDGMVKKGKPYIYENGDGSKILNEMVATVLYSYDELNKSGNQVSDKDF